MTAAAHGVVGHMPRRPDDGERAELIKSGNIFIYEETVSGIRRWTDGLNWSPSRILGNFLIYRELSEPFPAGQKKKALKKNQNRNAGRAMIRDDSPNAGIPEEDMRKLVGSLTDSYDFKEDGLVKKTISLSVQGHTHHIVSYYKPMDVYRRDLYDVCEDPFFRQYVPPLDMLKQPSFRTDILQEIAAFHQEIQNFPPETLEQLGLQQLFYAIPNGDHPQQLLVSPEGQPQQQAPFYQNAWNAPFAPAYNGSQEYYSCVPQTQHHQSAMLQSVEDTALEAHGHQQALSQRLGESPHMGHFDPQTIPRHQSFSAIKHELRAMHTFPQADAENEGKRESIAAMPTFDDVNYHGLPGGSGFYMPATVYNPHPTQQDTCAFQEDMDGLKLEEDSENVDEHHDWPGAV